MDKHKESKETISAENDIEKLQTEDVVPVEETTSLEIKKNKLHIGWWIGTTILSLAAAVSGFFVFLFFVYALVCHTVEEQVTNGAILVSIIGICIFYFGKIVPFGHRLKMFGFGALTVIIGGVLIVLVSSF